MRLVAWCVLALLAFAPVAAAQQAMSVPANAAPAASISDEALAAFVDGAVHAFMHEHDLPGMQVAVVRDGRVALLRRYGYADIEQRTPMDPAVHSMRIASISKTFTWVAAMQLAERGQLDLDADVNTYLRAFQIPDAFGAPVTMRHLMNHAAGFEQHDLNRGFAVSSPEQMTSIEAYLRNHMPARVRPPGEISAYSNYGATLAGYIVEVVAGVPFETYVEANILQPLAMTGSTLRQPLAAGDAAGMPAPLLAARAQSYRQREGRFRPSVDYFMPHAPAGAMRANAADMSRYMLALLGDGGFQGGRILQPETLAALRQQTFTHAPALSGWAHGFREMDIGEVRTLGHGGSLDFFYSYMTLAPELNLGVFAGVNSHATVAPVYQLPDLVVRHLTGAVARPAALTPPADSPSAGAALPESINSPAATTPSWRPPRR